MTDPVVGTCSLCDGQVTVPAMWHGITPPTPTCASCHATAKPMGPVIEMEPRRVGDDIIGAFRLADGREFPVRPR